MSNLDLHIASVDPKLKPIIIRLREIILSSSRSIREQYKWSQPTYGINKDIRSIMAHKKHVNLQVFHQVEIEDAEHLVGTGKSMRHLKFEKHSDVKAGFVRKS